MKTVFYPILVVIVLLVGSVLFVVIDNIGEKEDLSTSISSMFNSSIFKEMNLADTGMMGNAMNSVDAIGDMIPDMSNPMDYVENTVKTISTSMDSMVKDSPDILKNSSSAIYKNGHLALGFEDGSLEITNSYGEQVKLNIHHKRINNLYIVKDKLVSSSDDGSLSIVNLKTLKIIKQMKGHGREVEGIIAFGDHIFSISKDRTIKIWEISSTGLARIIYF